MAVLVLAACFVPTAADHEKHGSRIIADVALSTRALSELAGTLASPAQTLEAQSLDDDDRAKINSDSSGAALTDSRASVTRKVASAKHMRVERGIARHSHSAMKGTSAKIVSTREETEPQGAGEEGETAEAYEKNMASISAMKEHGRWITHVRALCSASFAGGLTVGVVGTLLMLSLGLRESGKFSSVPGAMKKGGMLQASAASAVCGDVERPESTNQPGDDAASVMSATSSRCADSIESIHRFAPRCGFLVAMLLVQSLSSLMLAGFQDLIQSHPSIVFFLTMVVGTGGNVGGQSVVLAVRRLAYGEQVDLGEQVAVGTQLSAVLGPLALLRAYVQGTKLSVCLTIGVATILIVVIAASLGTALPKLLWQVRVDPAHATPVIQVLMDMVGVLTTCAIGYVILDVMLKPQA